jgi:precorrin-2 dehydrogenase/sirohydrochlorin ferrochelatase
MPDHAPYPIALLLEGQPCLVVGGGPVAARKLSGLVAAGAVVTVIAPSVLPELAATASRVFQRPYRNGDCAGFRLVITATGDATVDRAVFAEAEASGILVNAADNKASCRFFVPAVVRRGPVTVAVSTGGESPFVASWLRRRLEAEIGEEVGVLAGLLSRARAAVQAAGVPTEKVNWDELVNDDLLELLRADRAEEIDARVGAWLDAQLGSVALQALAESR